MNVFAGVVLGFLTLASIALAQDPTGPTYGGRGPSIDDQVGSAGDLAAGTLPFTGLDLALALATGLVLLTLGLLTRRLARSRVIDR